MSPRTRPLSLAVCLVLILGQPALSDPPPPGEALPAGAVARLGGTRLKHAGEVECLAFSADGKALASTGHDGILRLWDTATGREIRRKELGGKMASMVQQLAFAPDGKVLAFSGQDLTIHLWDAGTWQELRQLGVPGRPGASPVFAFSGDGKTIVWWANDNVIRLTEVATGKELRQWQGVRGHVPRFAFAPDGKTLAVVNGRTTTLFGVATGNELCRIAAARYGAYSLAFSPDSATLALGGFDEVALYEVPTGKERARLGRHERPIQWLAFAADGKTLVSASDDGVCRVWDPARAKEVRQFRLVRAAGSANPVSKMAFAPGARKLAWVPWANRIHLTDVGTGAEILRPGDEPSAGLFAFAPDGKTLASPGPDSVVRLWDVATGQVVRAFEGQAEGARCLGFSPDGKTVACVGGMISVWDAATGKQVRQFAAGGRPFGAVCAFSPDGKLLALGEVDLSRAPVARECKVRWYDLGTGKEAGQSQAAHSGSVWSVAFRPDGKAVASAGHDRSLRLWDTATGKELWRVQLPEGHSCRLAFSADGKTLITGQDYFDRGQTAVRITSWEAGTGKQRRQLPGQVGFRFAAFTLEGALAALVATDQTIRVWDVAEAAEAVRLKGMQGTVVRVEFALNGRWLATGGSDGTILVWDLARAARKER
jgi:WD40 repeat protein